MAYIDVKREDLKVGDTVYYFWENIVLKSQAQIDSLDMKFCKKEVKRNYKKVESITIPEIDQILSKMSQEDKDRISKMMDDAEAKIPVKGDTVELDTTGADPKFLEGLILPIRGKVMDVDYDDDRAYIKWNEPNTALTKWWDFEYLIKIKEKWKNQMFIIEPLQWRIYAFSYLHF